jgi:hypothetical protein
MKLDMKSGGLKDKQTLIAIVLISVIVLAGGWVVYSNFFAGGGGEEPPASEVTPPPAGGAYPTPGGPQPGPGGPTAGGPPPAAPPGPAPASPPQSSAAAPSAPAPSASAPSAPAAPARPSPVTPKAAMRTITVFGTVTVSYPSGWGIDLRSAGSAAVLTDGKGRFEIHAPNPTAADAKAVADSAFATVAKGGKATGQGALKVAGYDAYQYSVSTAAGAMRIVGIDSPTRIAIVERVKGGQLGAYKAAFDKMESGLQFR